MQINDTALATQLQQHDRFLHLFSELLTGDCIVSLPICHPYWMIIWFVAQQIWFDQYVDSGTSSLEPSDQTPPPISLLPRLFLPLSLGPSTTPNLSSILEHSGPVKTYLEASWRYVKHLWEIWCVLTAHSLFLNAISDSFTDISCR